MENENKKFGKMWAIIGTTILALAICVAGAAYKFEEGETAMGIAGVILAVAVVAGGVWAANRLHNK